MPPRKRINKNTATTYKLVHRPQNDPLTYDAEASQMVFQELLPPQAAKKRLRSSDQSSIISSQASRPQAADPDFQLRDNEGEAAEYGVYYDDTEYDYMQHLRDIGTGAGDSYYIEATPVSVQVKNKGKNKQQQEKGKGVSLDEALRHLDLDHEQQQAEVAGKLTDESILPSKNLRFITYQDQQDVPDALRGFKPDMDWRLREALEALDDDVYVDNDDQDLFDELAHGGEEIDDLEFEETGYEFGDEEDGWESDRTIKADDTHTPDADDNFSIGVVSGPEVGDLPSSDIAPPDAPSDPLAAFHAHKVKMKAQKAHGAGSTSSAIRQRRIHDGAAASTVLTSASFLSGRHKKRKGALTNPSTYSMTSSALSRTEGLTLLDARFDKVLETQYEAAEYELEDDEKFDASSVTTGITDGGLSMASGISVISGVSTMSNRAPDSVRKDFSGVMEIMDKFLGEYGGDSTSQASTKQSRRRSRRGWGGQTGMEQLDEIRKELGRPRLIGP